MTIPPNVQNVIIEEFSHGETYVGGTYFPFGTSVVAGVSVNEFFSVQRTEPFNRSQISFYWNVQTPPPFSPLNTFPFTPLEKGEIVNVYLAVFNVKVGNLDCIFKKAKEITSILDVKVRVQDGRIVGDQQVVQTRFDVPAGQYAVFKFPITYEGTGTYQLNLSFAADGGLVETDTTDNNYSISLQNLGS